MSGLVDGACTVTTPVPEENLTTEQDIAQNHIAGKGI